MARQTWFDSSVVRLKDIAGRVSSDATADSLLREGRTQTQRRRARPAVAGPDRWLGAGEEHRFGGVPVGG